MKKSTLLSLFLCCHATIWSESTFSFSFDPTSTDFAFWPEMCQARFAFSQRHGSSYSLKMQVPTARIEYWQTRAGAAWPHLHHFCKGAAEFSRARISQGQQRGIGFAIKDMNYTLARTPRDSLIWPDMQFTKAQALNFIGKREEAIEIFAMLQEMFPKDVRPYIESARLRKSDGDIIGAIELLKGGEKRVSKPGPIYFYLATYYFELGSSAEALTYISRAESIGVDMTKLKNRIAGH